MQDLSTYDNVSGREIFHNGQATRNWYVTVVPEPQEREDLRHLLSYLIESQKEVIKIDKLITKSIIGVMMDIHRIGYRIICLSLICFISDQLSSHSEQLVKNQEYSKL